MPNPNAIPTTPNEAFLAQIGTSVDRLAREASPGGSLHDVAVAMAGEPQDGPQYLPNEVADIIMPFRTDAPVRYKLLEDAPAVAKQAAEKRKADVFATATEVGMRRLGGVEDYSRIEADVIPVVQDGANRTSIVRRHVATQALRGANITSNAMYQLGSGERVITPKRGDGSDHPEHKLLRSLAGEYLPKGDFTAYDANLATLFAQGYDIETIVSTNPNHLGGLHRSAQLATASRTFKRAIELKHPDAKAYPDVTLIEPIVPLLQGGLDAVRSLEEAQGRSLEGKQLLIATNGQYRPQGVLQAKEWAESQGLAMSVPVAIGDEPGDRTPFKDREFTTAERSGLLYAKELASLHRLAVSYVIAHADQRYNLPGSVVITEGDTDVAHEPTGQQWVRRSGTTTYTSPDDPGSSF